MTQQQTLNIWTEKETAAFLQIWKVCMMKQLSLTDGNVNVSLQFSAKTQTFFKWRRSPAESLVQLEINSYFKWIEFLVHI